VQSNTLRPVKKSSIVILRRDRRIHEVYIYLMILLHF
jgi:hypothetical protein